MLEPKRVPYGFSTEDVRTMFTRYSDAGQIPADSDIEAMIAEIKPWYDNYCFSKECLDSDVRVFNCDMVLYYLRNYMDYGHAPEQMIDPNTNVRRQYYDYLQEQYQDINHINLNDFGYMMTCMAFYGKWEDVVGNEEDGGGMNFMFMYQK